MRAIGTNLIVSPADGALLKNAAGGIVAREIVGSRLVKPVDTTKTKPSEGIVEDVGPAVTIAFVGEDGVRGIRAGDRVLYRGWTGIECRIETVVDGEKQVVDAVITDEKHILAIPEDGETVSVK